ncbi:hypothetical protein [Streptomyces wuyuanensis]|uniref:Uncharacterized protein n=1 Tax=Streptomyces wuyuanensis TaxID=1196353 RepID=A0A1G9PW42_9ACTN|nr:hypothetical protein [Streptomyces wuyuanensis]SDM02863.1 hypothetical protein SAMN05444921_103102 [Streptomyces wuyuanensis]
MTTQPNRPAGDPGTPVPWYARSPHDGASALGVEPAAGLSSARAGALTSTFDGRRMNRVAPAQLALVVLVTQTDGFRGILGTTEFDPRQFGRAPLSAVALLLLWELGKFPARSSRPGARAVPEPGPVSAPGPLPAPGPGSASGPGAKRGAGTGAKREREKRIDD